MNPLTNMKNVIKLSEQDLYNRGKSSWHDQYRDSAWIFVGGLPYDLSEGDIICIFSQYGEVVNVNLIRAKDTGKSRGFCFLCYEDQRSTILAVDNFNGIKILNRTIRVDHVSEYKVPKEGKKTDEETKKLYQEGCAPKPEPIVPKIASTREDIRETIADQIERDIKLPQRLPIYPIKEEKLSDEEVKIQKEKKDKRKSKKKKSKKKKSKKSYSSDDSDSSSSDSESEKKAKTKYNNYTEKERFESSNKKYGKLRDRSPLSRNGDSSRSKKKSPERYTDSFKSKESQEYKDKPLSYNRHVTPNIPKRYMK